MLKDTHLYWVERILQQRATSVKGGVLIVIPLSNDFKGCNISKRQYPELQRILDELLKDPERNRTALLIYMRVFEQYSIDATGNSYSSSLAEYIFTFGQSDEMMSFN